jgi:hypothetical protein
MIVTDVYKGQTLKRVTLADVADDATDAELLRVALEAARETRSSIFGWDIARHVDNLATVTLFTD